MKSHLRARTCTVTTGLCDTDITASSGYWTVRASKAWGQWRRGCGVRRGLPLPTGGRVWRWTKPPSPERNVFSSTNSLLWCNFRGATTVGTGGDWSPNF